MSGLLTLGVSHRTAPLALREQLALTEGRAAGVLSALVSEEPISEAAALSTCNRTELYLVATDSVEAETAGLGVLAREAGIPPTELLGPLYSLRGAEAARHLFRVTAGLDSMIVGEAEIQGQVKRAYELALVEGATGPILNRMFRGALAAGKRARTETAVGEKGVSIPSVAVELAQRTLGDLSTRQVLLIGAGETAELTARSLAARGSDAVFIANRGYNRAISLAERFGGNAVRIDELPLQLASADIVVSTTNSPHHLIERPELELIMGQRDGSPLLLIDLAVPRDIDPDCREIEGVSLYDVDEVQAIVERNASGREAEARRAGGILDSELSRFERWLGAQEVMPTVAALRERADAIVSQVLAENATRWESLSATDRERVEMLARAIANRLLHEPTVRLKGAADRDDAYLQVSALRELFGLDADQHESGRSSAPPTERPRIQPEAGEGADVASLDERRRRSERG
jgi:glutamyl-tRNA reductase